MNWNFFKKSREKKKDDLDSDFLLPQDKKEIKKLTEVKSKHLQNVAEINHKITAIQNSTGTLIPRFVRLHNNLRQKYRWYYNWHTKPYAKSVHWLVLLLYLISLPFIYSLISTNIHKAKATTYDFPRWEWTNPLPTGNNFRDIKKCSQDNSLWAVGDSGTIMKSVDNGTTWTAQYTGLSKNLYSLTIINQSNIWVVGATGTVIRYNGISWTVQAAITNTDLYTITSLDENNIWAAGAGGKIFYYNGSSWTQQSTGTTIFLYSIAAYNSSNIWAAGGGKILKYNGSSWSIQENNTSTIHSIYIYDLTHVFAVSDSSGFYQYDGANWTFQAVSIRGFPNFLSITGLSPTQIWVSTNTGQEFLYNGSTWSAGTIISSGNPQNVILALSASNIWAAGDNGTIANYNGSSWSSKNSGSNKNLADVTVIDQNNIWAVGDVKTILHYNGSQWVAQTNPTSQNLVSVSGSSTTNIWAISATSEALKYDGTSWNINTVLSSALHVYAFNANNVWAVGNSMGLDNSIFKYNGNSWSNQTTGSTTVNFSAVYALDANNVWAVGQNGKIYYTSDSGSHWSSQNSNTGYNLHAVFASSINDVWAVGEHNTILHYDGANWTVKYGGANYFNTYNSVIVSNSNIWITSLDGGLSRFVDPSIVIQYIPTSQGLSAIKSINSTDMILVGNGGTILNYHSPPNATATKLLAKLPGQSFADGVGVSGTANAVKAGEDVVATIYAVDGSNVLDKGNASIAGFTTTDPNDSNPAPVQLTQGGTCVQNRTDPTQSNCGIGTATFAFKTAGTWTITAADTYGVLSAGTSSSITVNPGNASKLYFSSLPSSLSLGSASSAVTLGVKDAYGNATTVSGSKTIRLSTNSGDGRFSTSPNGPWKKSQLDVTIASGSGSTTFYYLDLRTGSSTVTAAETPDAGWTDTSGNITIGTGTLTGSTLGLSSNSLSSCSGSITATVNLKNAEGLALTDRTVQLQSSRNTADTISDTISPTSVVTNASGVATFTVSSGSSGDFTLTAYDQTDNSYLSQSQDVHTASSGLAKISLASSASTITAGSSFNLATNLYNACDGLITDYVGEVKFTSSDNKAKFQEANHHFSSSDGGKYTQTVTLEKEGEQSISASAGGVTGTTFVTVTVAVATTPSTTTSPTSSITTSPSAVPTESPKSLVETFQESPVAQAISKALTPITATVATLGIFPLLVQAFPQGFHVLASLFPTIFTAAAIRRRRKPWGNVYDSLTGKPVDLAIVRVFNASNDRLVATKVTDENGRFNFLLSKGKYYVKVVKTDYLFPPKISKFKASQLSTRFGPQSDIYFGQSFIIGEDDTNLNLNIALDPKLSTLSLGTRLMIGAKNGLDWFLIALSYFAIPLMLIGAVFASLATFIIPSKFNLYMSGAYALLLVGYLISSRIKATRVGLVFNAKSRRPIIGATVLIFDKEYNAIREIKTTDQHGHFAILAQKGQYYLTVHAQGYKFPSKEFKFQKSDKKLGTIYLGQTINNKKADFVNVSIPLDKD